MERNHFGVYKYGGGQLSLTGPVDHVSIANNVFVGTTAPPGYRSRMAIIGAKGPIACRVSSRSSTTRS